MAWNDPACLCHMWRFNCDRIHLKIYSQHCQKNDYFMYANECTRQWCGTWFIMEPASDISSSIYCSKYNPEMQPNETWILLTYIEHEVRTNALACTTNAWAESMVWGCQSSTHASIPSLTTACYRPNSVPLISPVLHALRCFMQQELSKDWEEAF